MRIFYPRSIRVRKNTGAVVGWRGSLDFVEGSNVTLTVQDMPLDDEVKVTIASSGGGGGADHNILSATHLDTVAASVVRGDLMVGNSTPKWARLGKGSAGQYPRYDGSDLLPSAIQASDLPSGIDTAKLSSGVVSNTELDYLDGVTSAIQTQLDGKARKALLSDGANVNLTGTTSETTLKTLTITGGTMGANGFLRIYLYLKLTGTAGIKTIRVKLGATTLFAYAITATVARPVVWEVRIFNRNSQSSQAASAVCEFPLDEVGGFTSATADAAAANVATEDTSADKNLVITGQLANSGDAIDFRGWTVEVVRS